jgi:hypothetical protein
MEQAAVEPKITHETLINILKEQRQKLHEGGDQRE